jgi:farnesyl-diphosphate farnesyltransferase
MPGRWNDPDSIFKPGAVDVGARPLMQRGCSWNLSGNPDKSVTGLSTSTLIGLGTMFGADGSPVLLTTLLRDVSRSFYLTLRVLPSRVRAPIGLAYLLARATDTLADASSVPVAARRAALESLRDRILDEQAPNPTWADFDPSTPEVTEGERVLLKRIPEALALLDHSSVWEKTCIRTVLETIVGGQILDLDRFGGMSPGQSVEALPDAAALDDYTYRVAGCVGEFWTQICRHRLFPSAALDDEAFRTDGIRFGKGLQLINILRDLPKDLQAGRCYLPLDELKREGLTPADLLDPTQEARLRPIYDRWLQQAESHLVAGWNYVLSIPRGQIRVRLACAWPILIGIQTLVRLRQPGVLNARHRVKISRTDVRSILWATIWRLPFRRQWEGLFESMKTSRDS